MKNEEHKRTYRLGRRAEAAEATGRRILDAFMVRLRDDWFDGIRLDDLAQDAGVTVQTVLRRYGSKDGLIEAACERLGDEVRARRRTVSGDVDAAIAGLVEDYEASGDLIIRILAQEDRYPALRTATDIGRAGHRAWLAEAFAPWLSGLPPAEALVRLDALVAATDVYVWKLVRRDMARPVQAYADMLARLISAALSSSSRPTPILEPQP